MKIQIQYKISIILLLAGIQTIFAQKKEENIGSEVVNIVKPYTPTISDAFKVKESPNLNDEDNASKAVITYSILPFPVASTFEPSKGKAASVDKAKQEALYSNYLIGGFGNYFTPLAELYVTHDLGNDDYVAGMVKYISSAGGIEDIPVDDGYMKSSIDLTYGKNQNNMSWSTSLGFQAQKYHWYGLPSDISDSYTTDDLSTVFNTVDEPQFYNNFYIGGKLKVNEGIFKELSLEYDRFWDAFTTTENRFVAYPSFVFDVSHETIKTDFIVDYVGGSFDNFYDANQTTEYGFANFGISPSFAMQRDDWSFNIGATLMYSMDTQHSDDNIFIYPEINASYNVVDDLMIFYAGVTGGLEQNSYRNFTNENPFISPSIYITPTNKQYDVFAGLKGKFTNTISYNIKGAFKNEKNFTMFKSNDYSINIDNPEYAFGNSFGVVYDDVQTLNFFGEIKGSLSNDISFGINGTFSSYNAQNQPEVWNLPAVEFGANLDSQITEKWSAGVEFFYVGERKDLQINNSINYVVTPIATTLESYFDMNANVKYQHSDRLSGFLRLNNLTNQGYQKWLNYPVQSFQFMLGAAYKFDF